MTNEQKIASAKFSAIISEIKKIIREKKGAKLSSEEIKKIDLLIADARKIVKDNPKLAFASVLNLVLNFVRGSKVGFYKVIG